MEHYEDVLAAIQALGEASLKMRKPGDWYVSQSRVDVKVGGLLEGRYGNGETPAEAVFDHWRKITDLNAGEYVVIDAMGSKRRAVRWNGFMWADVHESE